MNKTKFKVKKMDCPCEENLIRLKLQENPTVQKLEFDLKDRTVTVFHTASVDTIHQAISELNLGERILETVSFEGNIDAVKEDLMQRKYLLYVLLINFSFFVIEMLTGIFSRSMGLVADSLDMLADAMVYFLSLLAVGATILIKKRVALLSGCLQLLLAVVGLTEVIRRFIGYEAAPDFRTMILVSIFALAANVVSLVLLQKSGSKEAHIQASVIFSSNDVVANLGVILAGLLVWKLNNAMPDLVIGCIVFAIVMFGAFRIFKLAR